MDLLFKKANLDKESFMERDIFMNMALNMKANFTEETWKDFVRLLTPLVASILEKLGTSSNMVEVDTFQQVVVWWKDTG